MQPDDLISITSAARELECGRATLYRALDDGRLTGVEVDGRRMLVKDEAWEDYEPNFVGRRAQKFDQDGDEDE
jgi:excisionase family DNA binding protein